MWKQIRFTEKGFFFKLTAFLFAGTLLYFLLESKKQTSITSKKDKAERKYTTAASILDKQEAISQISSNKSSDIWGDVPHVDEVESLGLERNAFFVETSGTGQVNIRQLLGVESAARNLRDLRNLYVYIVVDNKKQREMSPFVKTPIMVSLVTRYPAIQFRLVTFKDFVIGTPLEGWIKSKKLERSNFRMEHISDAFRTILLARYGGIYLDFDVLFIRWWTFPNNSVFWENHDSIGNCIMAFRRNHPMMSNFTTEFVKNYDPEIFIKNGPELVKEIYFQCIKTGKCDVKCFSSQMASPLHFTKMKDLFKDDKQLTQKILDSTKDSFAVHYSNSITKGEKLLNSSQSAVSIFSRLNCPIVWKEIMKIGYA